LSYEIRIQDQNNDLLWIENNQKLLFRSEFFFEKNKKSNFVDVKEKAEFNLTPESIEKIKKDSEKTLLFIKIFNKS
jgi:hypothetical protein